MDSQKSKTIILSCLTILLVACICLALIVVSGVGVSIFWPLEISPEGGIIPPVIETIEPTTTPFDEFQTQEGELPAELAEVIFQIENEVIQIRGLTITDPVDRVLISTEDLAKIVAEDFFAGYTDEDARNDVLILSLLGLLPKDFDLQQLYQDLYSEQIAGFYDSEIEEIYVVKGTNFGGSEKLTYAHEFTHVLQDQTFGFDEGLEYNEDACERDSERCAAIQALIEGDATQTEILWFQTYATRDDYDDLMRTFDEFESPILDAAPPYIAADLYFPYEKGFAFVERLYNAGGFTAIDEAYENPPVTTEQILHPERYPDDLPQTVTIPDLSNILGEGWALYDQNVMGEWYTFLILNKAYDEAYRLPDDVAENAAEGWGGDAYAFYINASTEGVTFVMDTVWDTAEDAEEFADAFGRYASLRWEESDLAILDLPTWEGSDISIVLMLEGDRMIWVIAPTGDMVQSIITSLP